MHLDAYCLQSLWYAPEVDVTFAGELDVIEAKHAVRKHNRMPEAWLASRDAPKRSALAVASEEQGGARGNASSDERGEDEPGHVV